MPLTFQEKTRMLLASSGGSGSGARVGVGVGARFGEATFRLFAGGGLMSRLMVE